MALLRGQHIGHAGSGPDGVRVARAVDVTDLLALRAAWGVCPAPPNPCPADSDADGQVSVTDFLDLLAARGGCP